MQFSFAQEKTVTGVVSDASGTLPGANVVVKGTTKGTQTDINGKYSIKANEGDVLVFSFVGMSDMTAKVGSSNVVSMKMQDGVKLDNVVVVAYGKQKAKSIVGSVAVVGKDILEKQQATSVLTAIQGSVPGVTIISSGGQPGDNPTIRIRGIGSINASAEPLIIVDGAPFSGNINSISQDQIESMSVLKDASATVLYGSRGSNGVILITTKRGKFKSAPKVSFTTTVGVASSAVKLHDLLGSDEFMTLNWEALRNNNVINGGQTPATAGVNASSALVSTLGYNPYSSAQPVDANGNLVSSDKKWDTDWSKLMLNNSALRSDYVFGIDGGSENSSYSFGAGYLTQEGDVKTSKFDRFTTRLSVDTKVNDWFKAGLSSIYSNSKQNYPTQSGASFQSAVQWIYTVPSIYPLYQRDENGELLLDPNGSPAFDYGNNPSQIVNGARPVLNGENAYGALYNYKNLITRDNLTANGYMQFFLTKDLSFKTSLAYNNSVYDQFAYQSNKFGVAASVGGRVTQNRNISTSLNVINALNYTKSFGNHLFNADFIQESYQVKANSFDASGEGFLDGVEVLNGATTPTAVGGSVGEERISSLLGRLSYNYNEKYFLEASFRRDGSSRFADGYRYGNFFAVGGSWIIIDKPSDAVFNFLKLKGSYGELGNNRFSSLFPYLQNFGAGYNELGAAGVYVERLTDPIITWEKTASSNVGLDYGFLKNRITGSVEFYNKKSIDLAYDLPIPGSTGFTSINTNIGSIKNYGLEFVLSTKNIETKNFKWNTSLNFSFDNNEVLYIPTPIVQGTKRWEVGRSLYDFYLQEWAGVDPATGEGTWFKDVTDANGTTTKVVTNKYTDATRYYQDKSSLPDVVGGITNYFRYKNVDLNILLNFSYGSYVYDSTYANLMGGFKSAGNAGHADLKDRWQNPGDITNVPVLTSKNNDYNAQSTRFLYKNDYVRLKALNLGYNIAKDRLEGIGLSGARFYLQGDNLLTWQSHKGIDPEQSLAGTTDSRSYNQRIVSFGVNVQF